MTEVKRLLEQTFTGPPAPLPPAAANGWHAEAPAIGSSEIKPLDLAKLLAGSRPPIEWLWPGWLVRGDLAFAVGDPGVGKSLLGLYLAVAFARGGTLLGSTCSRGTAGVFDYENPLDEAHARLLGGGVTAADHAGLVYFHHPELDLARDAAMLANLIAFYRLELVVIDSLRRAAPGLDENDSAAVSKVLSPLRAISAKTGTTILVVHHPRKRSLDNSTEATQMVRGSGDLVASVDSLFYLRAKGDESFTLEHAKARRGRPHEPILVRIESDDERLALRNEGAVAAADDKVEALLADITRVLADDGGPLARAQLATRVGRDTKDGTYGRALNLGWQRGLLAKSDRERGGPVLYTIAEGFAP